MNKESLRTWIEVDLEAIRHNLRAIRTLLPATTKVMAVVKADAYGHGAVMCSRACLEGGASFLGVATLEEAIELHQAFPETSIVILGPVVPEAASWVVSNCIRAMVSSLDLAEALSQEAVYQQKEAVIHVKVDTGMGRIGAAPEELLPLVSKIKSLPGLRIEGLATHFATADCDPEYMRYQLAVFHRAVERLKAQGIKIPLAHAANSAAILSLPESHYHMVRPGLLVYGIPPFAGAEEILRLRPALSWKARVALVRHLPAGAATGYGCTCRLSRDSVLAALPVGYADGFPRALSNRGFVLIGGQRAPVMGRVCMDQCMVDVTDIPRIKVGEEAVLIGRQKDKMVGVNDMADLADTIHHEIVSRIGRRVPRVYLNA